jgi:spore maturation protein CgeB
MRFVIVNHSYEQFLDWLYESNPSLAQQPFAMQQAAYHATLFGSADFYVHALQVLGHEVHEFVCNNLHAQSRWYQEHLESCVKGRAKSGFPRRQGSSRFLNSLAEVINSRLLNPSRRAEPKSFELLLEQIRTIRPDVLYNQSVYAFDDDQLRQLKAHVGVLVGEHAAMPLPEVIDYRLYDLIVSSFPPTLNWLEQRGAHAKLNRLAFDPRVSALIPETTRDVRVSFVGSFLAVHSSRLEFVEAVAAQVPGLVVNGNITVDLPASSPLQDKIGPALWGHEMYTLLRRSTITLNHHGNVPPFANNMRLYEATGMGCLLITDYKDNLAEMFEPDEEVVTYRDVAECVDKIRFYLDDRNRDARQKIMVAGQRRTLSEHTYNVRMKHLIELIRSA